MENPHKILVLSEEGDLVARLRRGLNMRDFEIRHYHTAGEVLSCEHEWKPELMISDFEIGGRDVTALLETLNRRYGSISFIVILPAGRTLEVMRELRSRVAAFLSKPVSDEDLIYYVKAAFGRGDAPQNRREHNRYMFTVETQLVLVNPFDHSESRPIAALMRDVSRSGVSLIVRQLVPVPTMAKLIMHIADKSRPMTMLAKSMSCMLTQMPGVYRLGIKFIGLLPRELEETIISLQENIHGQTDIYMGKSFNSAVQEWLAAHHDDLPPMPASQGLKDLAAELCRRESEHDMPKPSSGVLPVVPAATPGQELSARLGAANGPCPSNGDDKANGKSNGNGHVNGHGNGSGNGH